MITECLYATIDVLALVIVINAVVHFVEPSLSSPSLHVASLLYVALKGSRDPVIVSSFMLIRPSGTKQNRIDLLCHAMLLQTTKTRTNGDVIVCPP